MASTVAGVAALRGAAGRRSVRRASRVTGSSKTAQKFKFKARYATFGFSDTATLDEGDVWPTAFAPKRVTAADEASIGTLVKRAVS